MKLLFLLITGVFLGITLILTGQFTVQYALGEDYIKPAIELILMAIGTVIWKHNADKEE